MRTEAEISRYQKTLAHYRDRAKTTITKAPQNSTEYTDAIKVFLRCDGAIEILNWVQELETSPFFSLTAPDEQKG